MINAPISLDKVLEDFLKQKDDWVVFVGSGISVAPPSCHPPATPFLKRLVCGLQSRLECNQHINFEPIDKSLTVPLTKIPFEAALYQVYQVFNFNQEYAESHHENIFS